MKIDRSFVAGIGGSLADEAIVAAVVDLAHALGLRVVAEGIEELHQADALIEMGAEHGQGFYFATPQAPEVVEPLLALGWCGAVAPMAPRPPADHRADVLPGYGSPARAIAAHRARQRARSHSRDQRVACGGDGSLFDEPVVYVNAAYEAETGYRAE